MKTTRFLIPCLIAMSFSKCGTTERGVRTAIQKIDTLKLVDCVAQEFLLNENSSKWGFNAPNFFHFYEPADQDLDVILKEINPKLIRFPGGTTANFYHPHEPGYGYRSADVVNMRQGRMKNKMLKIAELEVKVLNKTGQSENFISELIPFCKRYETEVLYVANMFSGTIEETLFAIRKIKTAGVSIRGIELGNEYYLNAYKNVFPGVNSYLDIAKTWSKALHKEFPEIPIAIIAAPDPQLKGAGVEESQSFNEWNQTVARSSFFDAYSVHQYLFPVACASQQGDELHECLRSEINNFVSAFTTAAIPRFLKVFGADRKMWLSEWNIHSGSDRSEEFTLQRAIFSFGFFNSIRNHSAIDVACYHNLLAQGNGFNAIRRERNLSSESGYQFKTQTNGHALSYIAPSGPGGSTCRIRPESSSSVLVFLVRKPNGREYQILNGSSNDLVVDISEIEGTFSRFEYMNLSTGVVKEQDINPTQTDTLPADSQHLIKGSSIAKLSFDP